MIAARIDAKGRAWCGRTGCKARAFGAYYYQSLPELHVQGEAGRPETHPDVTAEAMQRDPNGFGVLIQEARALGIDWREELGPGRIQPEPFGEEATRGEDTFGGLSFPWLRQFAFDGHWVLGVDRVHRRTGGRRRSPRTERWTSAPVRVRCPNCDTPQAIPNLEQDHHRRD